MATVNLFGELALEATAVQTRDLLDSVVKAEDSAAVSGDKGIPLLAVRQSADTTSTDADGDYTLIKVDEEGRAKVSTKPASFDPVSVEINTAGNSAFVDVSRCSNIVFHVKNTGSVTLAAGTFFFEGSIDSTNGTDGTWFTVQCVRSSANTIETTIALSGMAVGVGYVSAWEASVNGYRYFRVRCSVSVTINASATWTFQRGSYATEPVPGLGVSATQPVSGTVTANQGTLLNPTSSSYNSLGSTNANIVKATPGTVYSVSASNATGTVKFVKLYNTIASPVIGTTMPVIMIAVPATGTINMNFGTVGHRFSNGITFGMTALAPDSDTTPVGSGDLKMMITYI